MVYILLLLYCTYTYIILVDISGMRLAFLQLQNCKCRPPANSHETLYTAASIGTYITYNSNNNNIIIILVRRLSRKYSSWIFISTAAVPVCTYKDHVYIAVHYYSAAVPSCTYRYLHVRFYNLILKLSTCII